MIIPHLKYTPISKHQVTQHKKAVMEGHDFKTESTIETKAPGFNPSVLLSIWPKWNHCFSQIAEGSISREQGGVGVGLRVAVRQKL